MVVHIPIYRIIFPANLMTIISNTIEVAMFDVLPADKTTDLLFYYSFSQEADIQD